MSLNPKECRICGSENTKYNLFNTSLEADDPPESLPLRTVFVDVTNLSLSEDDGLPNRTCKNCIRRLQDAYMLKREAEESDARRKMLITAKDNKESQNECLSGIAIETKLLELALDDNSKLNQSFIIDIDDFMLETALNNVVKKNYEDHSDEQLQYQNQVDSSAISEDATEENANLPNLAQDGVELLTGVRNKACEDKPLIEPQKIKRTRNVKHTCECCNHTFGRKSCLIDHLRLHAKIKLFQCSCCDKSFVQIGNYRTHMRTHTNERPYKCHLCSKSYCQSSALKVHIRSHTQERNYLCDECGKSFTNSSDRNKHKRTHDPSQQIKCNFCDRLFAQKVNMNRHQLRSHTDEIGERKRRNEIANPKYPDELEKQKHPDKIGKQKHLDKIGKRKHHNEIGNQNHPEEIGKRKHPDEIENQESR